MTALGERVSAVLLTHNCAHRVAPIVRHLLELDIPVVAVDNGSTDDTLRVLRGFDDLKVVALPENIGAAGRNAGVAQVRTPYVLFCDDDGWYEHEGIEEVCGQFDAYPRLAVACAKILVGDEQYLDPISAEMADSPLSARDGEPPGPVLLGFMAGASMMRVSAYREVLGYDARFFMGGEEETMSFVLARRGWHMRYCPSLTMHHEPSLENAGKLRHYGLRNTLVNAWLHRRWPSAVRWTLFTLADAPKNPDLLRALALTVRAVPWIMRERDPMDAELDAGLSVLDARRFARRRPLLNTRDWRPGDPVEWPDEIPERASESA